MLVRIGAKHIPIYTELESDRHACTHCIASEAAAVMRATDPPAPKTKKKKSNPAEPEAQPAADE